MSLFPGLPDFSGIAKTADTLTEQFERIIVLLTKIADDTAAIRESIKGKDDDD